MPLRVIRDHLDAVERGLAAPVGEFGAALVRGTFRDGPRLVEAVPDLPHPTPHPTPRPTPHLTVEGPVVPGLPGLPGGIGVKRPEPDRRYGRGEMLAAAGIDEAVLADLESHGLVGSRPSGHFDGSAVVVARAAGELAAFGIEPRHLRAFRTAADREAGLIEQVTNPIRRRAASAARADDVTQELTNLCLRLHAALVEAALERGQA